MKSQQGNKVTLLRPLLSSLSLTSIILMSAILAITAYLILPLFGLGLNNYDDSIQGINQAFATHVNNTSEDVSVGEEEIIQQGIVVSREHIG